MQTSRTTPAAGPDGAGRARPLTALGLPVLLALVALAALVGPRPAGGDTVGDLRSQAAGLAHQLVLEQLQVDAYRQAADVAAARVAADEQEVRTLTGRIAAAQQAIDAKRRIVRTQAILTYINAGTAGSGVAGALFADASGDRAQAASEYADLAAGTITTAIAQLHTAQADLQDQEAALHQRQARDRADQSARATALAQATEIGRASCRERV